MPTQMFTKFDLFFKKYFKEVLTGKAFKHCMFELRLQISLYDQNLVRKEDFDFKSDFI